MLNWSFSASSMLRTVWGEQRSRSSMKKMILLLLFASDWILSTALADCFFARAGFNFLKLATNGLNVKLDCRPGGVCLRGDETEREHWAFSISILKCWCKRMRA